MGKVKHFILWKNETFYFKGKVKDILFHGRSERFYFMEKRKTFYFMGKVKDILFHGKIERLLFHGKIERFCFTGRVKNILFHGKSEIFYFMGKEKDILFHGKCERHIISAVGIESLSLKPLIFTRDTVGQLARHSVHTERYAGGAFEQQ